MFHQLQEESLGIHYPALPHLTQVQKQRGVGRKGTVHFSCSVSEED